MTHSDEWPLGNRIDDITALRGAYSTHRALRARTKDTLTRIVRRALSRRPAASKVERSIQAVADRRRATSIEEVADHLAQQLSSRAIRRLQ